MILDNFGWSFRQLESALASYHGIASSKRTTFAARLKNFHRLKFPAGFKAEHGKSAHYSPGEIAMMALAMEMTNLGLTPERIVRVLNLNWYPVSMALRMAAGSLYAKPDGYGTPIPDDLIDWVLSMFVYFDVSALGALKIEDDQRGGPKLDEAADSFFYGGEGVVRDNVVAWTMSRPSISLINITAMLDNLVGIAADDATPARKDEYRAYRQHFFAGVRAWACQFDEIFTSDERREAAEKHLLTFAEYNLPEPPESDEQMAYNVSYAEQHLGMDTDVIRSILTEFYANGGASHVSPKA